MQHKEFKLDLQFQILLILAFSVLWIVQRSYSVVHVVSPNEGPLYNVVFYSFNSSLIINNLISVVIPISVGFLLNELYKAFRALPRRSFFVVIMWLAILPLFPGMWHLSPQMIVSPIIIWGLFGLFHLADEDPKIRDLISISFVFSLASLIYFPLVWILLFLPLGIAIFRNFNFRFFLVIVITFLVPYIYLAFWYYMIDKPYLLMNLWHVIPPNYDINLGSFLKYYDFIPLIFLAAITVLSFYSLTKNFNNQLIQIRRLFSFTMVYMLFLILLALLYISDFSQNLFLIMMPVAVLLAVGITALKDKRIFWIVIGLLALIPILMKLLWL